MKFMVMAVKTLLQSLVMNIDFFFFKYATLYHASLY